MWASVPSDELLDEALALPREAPGRITRSPAYSSRFPCPLHDLLLSCNNGYAQGRALAEELCIVRSIRLFALSAALATAAVAPAMGTLYFTGFEAPPYPAGSHPNGIDGWAAGSGGVGAPISVSTDRSHGAGWQSLKMDNSSLESFYSVRRGLAGWTAASGQPLKVSVQLWVDGTTRNNRLYGLYFGSGATSTLGGTVLGVTIDGAGRIRGGTGWSSTYTDTGLFATAAQGTYLNRWLTVTLGFNPTTGAKTASIAGFGGTTYEYSNTWFGGSAPGNINLGTDYFADLERTGTGYFDDLHVAAVPEPGTLAALVLGAAAFGARRRRRAAK
jgi:hypothetical protein